MRRKSFQDRKMDVKNNSKIELLDSFFSILKFKFELTANMPQFTRIYLIPSDSDIARSIYRTHNEVFFLIDIYKMTIKKIRPKSISTKIFLEIPKLSSSRPLSSNMRKTYFLNHFLPHPRLPMKVPIYRWRKWIF